MKLCEYIDKCLSDIGVKKIFGIPGSLIMPVWQNLSDKEIVLCSHEQEASYVATGYGKMTKQPVCVITTGGPGVTNCVSGIASSNIDSVPLIYITGRTPISKQGHGLRQEESTINRLYDSVDILKPITKTSVCIDNIVTAPQVIQNTIKMAFSHRQGAVHISIPIDLQNEEIEPINSTSSDITVFPTEKTIPITDRPLFILGWGSWMSDAYEMVYLLANRVCAPVLVTSKAYCCIDKENVWFLGKLGYGYNIEIENFIKEYRPDSIVIFGSSLGEKDIGGSILQNLVEILPAYFIADDCEHTNSYKDNIKKITINNMKEYVAQIIGSIQTIKYNKELENLICETGFREQNYWKKRIVSSDTMARCIDYINEVTSDDCIFFADAGNHLSNAGALITPKKPGHMFLDVGLRAMGTGICTAVGMALANSSKKYIAITGDGCMLMNGNIMHLVAEKNLPVLFIVFNNHSLGRVRVGQSIMNDYRGTDINNVSYSLYAKAFGISAYVCESFLIFKEMLPNLIKAEKPVLLEVITSNDEIPIPVKGNIY